MPYNTRHKSLSLPSLGIHVPLTHAERAAAAAESLDASSPERGTGAKQEHEGRESSASHPHKRLKRSRSKGNTRPPPPKHSTPATPPRDTNQAQYEHTPPPSPRSENSSSRECKVEESHGRKVDTEGIKDEVVEAVIAQLQATANRPHLLKELAAVLGQNLANIHQSANPCAIISSRLSLYLKRTCWSALAPCPLAKELESVHPRRTYFYLTTCPHGPLSDPSLNDVSQRAPMSPPHPVTESSVEVDQHGDIDIVRNRVLSPSPEIDLSPPHFNDMDEDMATPSTPAGYSTQTLHMTRSHMSASPPLEKDEREFTQTADGLQKRKLTERPLFGYVAEQAHADDLQRDEVGFDDKQHLLLSPKGSYSLMTSPAIRATFHTPSAKKDTESDSWAKLGNLLEWGHEPENIELDELECLLEAC